MAAEQQDESAEFLIRVDQLAVEYGLTQALADVSLAIPGGAVTAIIGPSGCGKTSFLWSLNRLTDLVPAARVRGRVIVGTTDVFAPQTDVIALRRRVGMIFQKPNPFPLSVRKNIELGLIDHGMRVRRRREEVMERVLRDVGLWHEVKDRLGGPAPALSGGQQQRLCLARALALDPEIILLDEPCSALDPLSSGVVEDLIADLAPRYTVVMVTHNLALARRLADHVALFWIRNDAGRLIETGTVGQVFERPVDALTAAYIRGARG